VSEAHDQQQSRISPQPLEMAHGIRFPRDDEYRWSQDDERDRVAQAKLTTGYVLREAVDAAFSTFFEANVHASGIWTCFCDLVAALLPEVAAPLVQFKNAEPSYGTYAARADGLGVFQPHASFLQHEGYLGFGMMFQYRGMTEEVFVHPAKYLQVWTNKPDSARAVFARHGLVEVPDLRFINEYPMVTEALADETGNSIYPRVLQSIEAAFDALVPILPPESEA
jgi:hypothetical protein